MIAETSTESGRSELNDEIAAGLARGDELQLTRTLAGLHPGQIADALEALPAQRRVVIWALISDDARGDVLVELSDAVRDSIVETMAPADLLATTEGLDPDDVADLVGDLPSDLAEDLLRAMDEQERARLGNILAYPEDTAGGLMTPEVITVRGDTTLGVIFRYLRQRGSIPDTTDSLAVVDRHNIYLGQLPISTLLTRHPDTPVAAVMDFHAIAIEVTTPASEVALLFEQRDLVSAPVVDTQHRLLGRITIDDVVDVLRESADSSFLGMAGVDPDEDLFAPVMRTVRGRNVWLGVNLITALVASAVIGLFDATLEKMVALAILMPIVASMGGNAGNQTLAIVIRGMALHQVSRHTVRGLVRKELLVGLANGTIWASVIAATAGLWFRDPALGAVIGCAMVINLICAAGAGFAIPVFLRRIGVDPAVASSVFLTTVTDVVGFFAFLGLAAQFLV